MLTIYSIFVGSWFIWSDQFFIILLFSYHQFILINIYEVQMICSMEFRKFLINQLISHIFLFLQFMIYCSKPFNYFLFLFIIFLSVFVHEKLNHFIFGYVAYFLFGVFKCVLSTSLYESTGRLYKFI